MRLIQHQLRRRRVLCVRQYSRSFYSVVDSYYKLLDKLGARYVYECRRGVCYSYIVVNNDSSVALLEAPGLVIEEAKKPQDCVSDNVMPLPLSEAGFLDTGLVEPPGGECFVLGFVGSKRLCIEIDDVWRHIWVLGSTGSGKTHTAARLARCLSSKGLGILVLDWHGEYARLLREIGVEYKLLSYPSAPSLPLVNTNMPLEVSIDILEHVLNLSPFQTSILSLLLALVSGVLTPEELKRTENALGSTMFNTLSKLFERNPLGRGSSLRDLYTLLLSAYEEVSAQITRSEREIWSALIRRIQIFITSGYEDLFKVYDSFPDTIRDPGGVVVVDLSSIRSLRARRLYAYFLLYGLYFSKLGHAASPGLVVVIEEAHNLLDLDIVPVMLQEARKYKLGLIIVTHTPSLLPVVAQTNLNTLIIHRMIGEKDKEFLSHIIGVRELSEIASSLRPGEAIVFTRQGPVVATIRLDAECA